MDCIVQGAAESDTIEQPALSLYHEPYYQYVFYLTIH